MTIGQRINRRRIELGLSVEDVARRLNKNRATVYRYESDYIENLPISVLEPLAQILHTTPAYLMGWTVDLTTKQLQCLYDAKNNGFYKTEVDNAGSDVQFLCGQNLLEGVARVDAPDYDFDYYKITELGEATLLNQNNDIVVIENKIVALSEFESELINICAGLDVRRKTALLTYAYELEKQAKDNK